MTNPEIEETLKRIAGSIEASNREWEKRREADRREREEQREADRREREEEREADRREWKQWRDELQETVKRHDETLLVHARLIMDNERDWKRQMEDLRDIVQHHENRLGVVQDGMATMLASMDKLFKTIDDFIKGLNRQDGHRE